MIHYNNFESLTVFSLCVEDWSFPVHKHNFYELVLVEDGSGIHKLNDMEFPYQKGDVFLLYPGDYHAFDVLDETTLTYMKFTEQLFEEKAKSTSNTFWSTFLADKLQHNRATSGTIIHNEEDLAALQYLMLLLNREYNRGGKLQREMVLELFGSVMLLIARNKETVDVNRKEVANAYDGDRVHTILSYIRTNIWNSEKISLDVLSQKFALSVNYISIYVKKQTGLSIQQHITNIRLGMAEELLAHGYLNINEIAERLGFNDASHFNKLFKKKNKMTPTQYRKESFKDKGILQ